MYWFRGAALRPLAVMCWITVSVIAVQGGVISSSDCLPPLNGVYAGEVHSWPGFTLNNPMLSRFSDCLAPPPNIGDTTLHTFTALFEGDLVSPTGATMHVAGDASVQVLLEKVQKVQRALALGDISVYEAEILMLDIDFGLLLPAIKIRQSSLSSSGGETTIEELAQGFAIDSFFDVFTELSIDGGRTWLPSQGSTRMSLQTIPEPATLVSLGIGLLAIGIARLRRRAIRALFVFPALCLLVERPSLALPVQPPGLQPGDAYHWMFVTRGTGDATSTDINDYNDFVRSEAALNPSLTGTNQGVQWYVIGSTPTVDARDNAVVLGPVYLLNGSRFSDGFADMWCCPGDGDIHPRPNIDQFGVERPEPNNWVWTGSNQNGTSQPDQELGAPASPGLDIKVGNQGSQGEVWLAVSSQEREVPFPLYALSSPMKAETDTTVPEPTSFLLFATAVCLAAATGLMSKRQGRVR